MLTVEFAGRCPDQIKSSPHPYTIFPKDQYLYCLSLHASFPLSGFPTRISCAFLISCVLVIYSALKTLDIE
jgi:hypothetical protein